jgi:hypothetical protein
MPLTSLLANMAKKKLVRLYNFTPSLTLSKITVIVGLAVILDNALSSLLWLLTLYLRESQLEMPTFPETIFEQKVWVQVIPARHYFLLSDVPLPWGLRFDTSSL